MDSNLGNKSLLWAGIGGEMMGVAFELRYMIAFSIILIVADFWWGHCESMQRYEAAVAANDSVGIEKYKWRKSRALRRTTNKFVDYMTYLLVGAFLGLAITEPMDWLNHRYTAAGALCIGCLAEIASIIGHYCYLKFGIEVKVKDVWRWLFRFLINLFTFKSAQIGTALEQTIKKDEDEK